jgi:hypothetical protein
MSSQCCAIPERRFGGCHFQTSPVADTAQGQQDSGITLPA